MAFVRENLSNVAASAPRGTVAGTSLYFQLWHYATDDASITGAGYFAGASTDPSIGGDGSLNDGDLIFAVTGVGAAPAYAFYVVTDAAAGTVTALP